MEFQGGAPQVEEKHGFPGGSIGKNGKFQGDHVKFDWKSRGVNFKKIDSLNRGVTIVFWKSPISIQVFLVNVEKRWVFM